MRFPVFLLSVLCVLLACSTATALPHQVNISIEAFGNVIDGSPGPSCDASIQVRVGEQKEWWITVGEARPDSRGGWESVGNAIRCGIGSSEGSSSSSGGAPRTPYLMANLSTMAAEFLAATLIPEKVLQVEISLSLRKFSDFSATGEPRYEQSTEKRTFFFLERGTAFLPLVVSNEKEQEAFKLHEALIRIGVELIRRGGPAAYGALSVSSDLDDAELRVDGGVVGRVSAGKETFVTNVLVGDHEVSLRDSAGHEIHRIVPVERGRTAMASLKFSDSRSTPYGLVSLGKNAQGYEEYRREIDGGVVVRIPAGEFLMGNRETERNPLEHRVDLSEFLMDKTGVTFGQFKKFLGATGGSLPPHEPYWGIHDDQPAAFVTWDESRAYCNWVGGRLPTEAEREKAARGTDGRKYPWGNEEPTSDRAVFRRNWGDLATDPVGSHPLGASPYGLLDMGGNMWEFCADWFDDKYFEVSPKRDPKGPRTGRAQVCKGGSWDSRPTVLSASSRNTAYLGYREGDFGFRCAMDPAR